MLDVVQLVGGWGAGCSSYCLGVTLPARSGLDRGGCCFRAEKRGQPSAEEVRAVVLGLQRSGPEGPGHWSGRVSWQPRGGKSSLLFYKGRGRATVQGGDLQSLGEYGNSLLV